MSAAFNTEQERFWAETYAEDYVSKNDSFDKRLSVKAWLFCGDTSTMRRVSTT
jgi:hypothetical protein